MRWRASPPKAWPGGSVSPLVVENRPGAGARLGLEALAGLPPDSYQIGFVAATLNSLQTFYKDWKRDAVTSFTYIGSVVESQSVLWASANTPGKSLAELLAHYQANPGKINIAYTSPGPHALALRHLDAKWGLKATHVNYKGTAEAKLALLSGDVQLMTDTLASSLPDLRAGKLKALAIIAPRRLSEVPEVPTLQETRTTDHDIDTTSLFGVIAPAGLPEPVTARLSQALADSMKDAETLNRLQSIGGVRTQFRPGAEFRAITKGQVDIVNRLAREFGIEPQ